MSCLPELLNKIRLTSNEEVTWSHTKWQDWYNLVHYNALGSQRSLGVLMQTPLRAVAIMLTGYLASVFPFQGRIQLEVDSIRFDRMGLWNNDIFVVVLHIFEVL